MNYNSTKIPSPIIDSKEDSSLHQLSQRYEKLTNPLLAKVGKKISAIVPDKVKQLKNNAQNAISEKELIIQCMKVVSKGFSILEQQASRLSISEAAIIKKVNKISDDYNITTVEELCLIRSYELSKLANTYKTQDVLVACAEGAATGYFGFIGLPFNLVLSTFLCYRAVQSIAMIYGYDTKNDPAELVIASEVFMNSLSPSSTGSNEAVNIIGKIMMMTEFTATKQLSKKTWEEMAKHGGLSLLICQMRALANKAAQKGLEKAGQKGLEESLFKGVFEQIGKGLSKKAAGESMPVFGAIAGALFDTSQINTVIEYADVFYHKRFLIEKEVRINMLLERNS